MTRPAVLVLALTLATLPWTSSAQSEGETASAAASVSATRVRADVEFLADDLLEGREAATRGYELAARYAAAALTVRRLRTGRGRRHLLPAGAAAREHADGDVDAPDHRRRHGRHTFAGSGDRRAERRAAGRRGDVRRSSLPGSASRRPSSATTTTPALDVKGKIVALLFNAPGQAAERAARPLRLDRPQAEERGRPRRRRGGHRARARRREALSLGAGEGVLRPADVDAGWTRTARRSDARSGCRRWRT